MIMAGILLIESDLILAESITKYLQALGHNIDWCSDAQLAVNRADESAPDLVILELQLAGHSGVEFLYEFRSYPEWQNIPIIIFSSIDEAEIEASSLLFGPLDILAYHHKHTTSLKELGSSVKQAAGLKKV